MIYALAAMLTLGVFAVVLRPILLFTEQESHPWTDGSSPLEALLEQKSQILAAIKELDLDHSMDKMNDQDYRAIRRESFTRAAEIIQQIDQLAEDMSTTHTITTNGQSSQYDEG